MLCTYMAQSFHMGWLLLMAAEEKIQLFQFKD